MIGNTLQMNGILLNDDWCRFFHDNNFLIGLSLDGPKELHDIYRKDKGSVREVSFLQCLLMENFLLFPNFSK